MKTTNKDTDQIQVGKEHQEDKQPMKHFNIAMHQIDGDRGYQEDYLEADIIDDNTSLLILADGMGGYDGGREASETVVKSFKVNFDKSNPDIKDALHKALIKANEDLAQAKIKNPKFDKMGTTLIALYINVDFVQWVSVGDSPLFLINKDKRLHKDQIKRINKNHSIAGLLELQYQHGEITKEEMMDSPNRHMLTSAITGDPLKSIDLSDRLPIEEGDTFVLSSDGLETLTKEEIKDIVLVSRSTSRAVTNLLDAVTNKKSLNQDNTSVIVISPKNKPKSKTVPIIEDEKLTTKLVDYNMLMIYFGVFLIAVTLLYVAVDSLWGETDDTNTSIAITPEIKKEVPTSTHTTTPTPTKQDKKDIPPVATTASIKQESVSKEEHHQDHISDDKTPKRENSDIKKTINASQKVDDNVSPTTPKNMEKPKQKEIETSNTQVS